MQSRTVLITLCNQEIIPISFDQEIVLTINLSLKINNYFIANNEIILIKMDFVF